MSNQSDVKSEIICDVTKHLNLENTYPTSSTNMFTSNQCDANSILIVCNGAKHLNLENTYPLTSTHFSGGEINIQLDSTHGTNVRGKNVVIVQGFSDPNEHLMELFLTVDAVKRAGGQYITAILPYLPYSRQDKLHAIGTPVSCKVICDMINKCGIDRLISMDLHNEAVQGFLGNRVEFVHIRMEAFFTKVAHILFPKFGDETWKFVSVDLGSVKRIKNFALYNNSKNLCNIVKYRDKAQEIESTLLIGDVKGYNVALYDDMIDTAGSIQACYNILREHNAERILVFATHPVFSIKELVKERLDNITVVVTNSFPIPMLPKKTIVVSLKELINQIIYCTFNNLNLESLNYDIPFNPIILT